MIAIHSDTVFVAYDDGRSAPFDAGRLSRSISRAAVRAGHPFFSQANQVIAALTEYLREDWPRQTVTRGQLLEAVAAVLEAIGYREIADSYRRAHQHAVVDLAV